MIPIDNRQIVDAALAARRAGADPYTYLAGQWNVARPEAKRRIFEALYGVKPSGDPIRPPAPMIH